MNQYLPALPQIPDMLLFIIRFRKEFCNKHKIRPEQFGLCNGQLPEVNHVQLVILHIFSDTFVLRNIHHGADAVRDFARPVIQDNGNDRLELLLRQKPVDIYTRLIRLVLCRKFLNLPVIRGRYLRIRRTCIHR